MPGAIATIRLHGPLIEGFLKRHLSREPKLRRCVHCELKDGSTLIDDPVAVLLSPDCLELHLHGGPQVLRATFELLARSGFERTETDVWAETEDPVERQMLIDLPRAQTREALRILLAQPETWRMMLQNHDHSTIAQAMADRTLVALLNPPTVAIVGLPNVGKSTLSNALFARAHSIAADQPGTTRDWVGEPANIDGLIVTLIDTPGQRATSDAIEAAAIERSIGKIATAELILLVEDASRPADASIIAMRERYPQALRVLNKCDIAIAGARSENAGAIRVSAKTSSGLVELRQAILDAFGCDDLQSPHARCWTHQQREMLRDLV